MRNPLEEVATKATGVARAAAARLEGLIGVFNSLTEHHAELLSLVRQARSTHDAPKQDELWQRIRGETLSHERAEAEVLYTRLASCGAHHLVRAHETQTKQLEATVHRVSITACGTNGWNREMRVLMELLEEHAHQEEQATFPRALELLGRDRAKTLELELDERRQEILREL